MIHYNYSDHYCHVREIYQIYLHLCCQWCRLSSPNLNKDLPRGVIPRRNSRDSPSVSGVIFSRQEPDSWNLLWAIFNVCKESWNTPSSWSSCCLNIVSCWRFKFGRFARLITCVCGDDFTAASCDILELERREADRRYPSEILHRSADRPVALYTVAQLPCRRLWCRHVWSSTAHARAI